MAQIPALQIPQMQSPLESYGKMMSLQNLAQSQRLGAEQLRGAQMQNQEQQTQIDEDAAYKQALAEAGGDIRKALPKLMQVAPTRGIAIQKQITEWDTADINKKKGILELHQKTAERLGQIAGTVTDQNSWLSGIQTAANEGLITPEQAQQYSSQPYDPNMVKGLQSQALTAIQQVEQAKKDLDFAETKRHNLATENKMGVDESIMKDWLAKNPGKTPSDFLVWKNKNSPSAMLMGGVNLTPEAIAMAGQLYAQTGQLPGGLTRSPQTTGNIINAAAANNPGNDIAANKIQYQTVAALNKDFFGGGKASQNIRSLNTAIGHLGQLYLAADALDNGDIKKLNQIANFFKVQTGASAPVVFDAIKTAATGELGSTFKGSAATDPEIANLSATLSRDLSGKVNKDVIKTDAHLLMSRLYALDEQYKQNNNGKAASKGRILYPNSEFTLRKMGVQQESAPQNQSTAQPIYATNPQTKQRIVSQDGGKTWQLVP